jgi:F0F1-type ATP synthase epsilon subunit
MTKPSTTEKLRVIARAPFHVYYDGEADAVSGKNRIGEFSVLPGHADFFSMLVPGPIEIHTEDATTSFTVESGLVTVRQNEVYIFVNV